MKNNYRPKTYFTDGGVHRYDVFVDGVYFTFQMVSSEQEAIDNTRRQIDNLHPLNMTAQGAIEYRKRFQNKPITAKKMW